MIDRKRLLLDLKKLLRTLEADLEERCATHPETDAHLREAYGKAREAGRTAQTYETWRQEPLTQAAVAWILSAVFVRFLEDNGLLDDANGPRRLLWGTTPELWRNAEERYTATIRARPGDSDREVLLGLFDEVGRLPGAHHLFDRRHNPAFTIGLTAEGAKALREAWQARDAATGGLVHDFGDPAWDTRFLGDLYQDLSEYARERYALLQTPDFVEEFLLDRTLTPAIAEFGFETVRLIDPACGSGHFLLGAFRRLVEVWRAERPGLPPAAIAQKGLDAVFGVDLNPYAAAIARFRLLVAAVKVAGLGRLVDAPDFTVNVAAGDSLLHGPRPGSRSADRQPFLLGEDPIGHLYETEDEEELRAILGQRYHAVVANPPYITVKDAALNQLYRDRFMTCKGKYSLVMPFLERLVDLCHQPANGDGAGAGWVGVIASNAFMKREFGTKFVEEFLPRWDLTHVIDTSGAYIPGHGTPTVILFVRGSRPIGDTVRAVMGIRGEPTPPDDAAKGLVWTAIVEQVDRPGSQSAFVSVADVGRDLLTKHPWSMGGGGAAELKQRIDGVGSSILESVISDLGRTTHTGEDDAFYLSPESASTLAIQALTVPLVTGQDVRDYEVAPGIVTIFPYSRADGSPVEVPASLERLFWPSRTVLKRRRDFGQTPQERGLRWFDHSMFFAGRFSAPFSIAFPFVATHNHFALDRGGKVFNRTAPVIKLRDGATEDDHLALLGLLNSSTGVFWVHQVCHNKGAGGGHNVEGGRSTRGAEDWECHYEHDAGKVQRFPLPTLRSLALGRAIDALAQDRMSLLPAALVCRDVPSRAALDAARSAAALARRRMIALQEELDWRSYVLYGLLPEDLTLPIEQVPEVDLGQRAFEIALGRQVAAGEVHTNWFERHGSTPITEIPARWPEPYRALVARRLEAIESNPNIALIEKPEYKRRWNTESWDDQERRALHGWLLDRLEEPRCWPEPNLQTAVQLCDRVRHDADFRRVAELYTARPDVDLEALVATLALEEAVPFLAAFRYTEDGLKKRVQWERTWDLQRREDAIDARTKLPAADPRHLSPDAASSLKKQEVGDIPVPPKYGREDFRKGTYWSLRGKLDVPKERFVNVPGAERAADPSPLLGWAGWDHLQRARALAAFYVSMKTDEGWQKDRLVPLLAGLSELVPWLLQWHDDLDPALGTGQGTFYAEFVESEARELGETVAGLAAWRPVAEGRGRGRKKK